MQRMTKYFRRKRPDSTETYAALRGESSNYADFSYSCSQKEGLELLKQAFMKLAWCEDVMPLAPGDTVYINSGSMKAVPYTVSSVTISEMESVFSAYPSRPCDSELEWLDRINVLEIGKTIFTEPWEAGIIAPATNDQPSGM